MNLARCFLETNEAGKAPTVLTVGSSGSSSSSCLRSAVGCQDTQRGGVDLSLPPNQINLENNTESLSGCVPNTISQNKNQENTYWIA